MDLDDFIRYTKEQFDCDIIIKKCDKQDSFETIFNGSFLNEENYTKEQTVV